MSKLIDKLLRKKKNICGVVIVAAGSATRMKGIDKILHPLGGMPLIVHSVAAFQMHESVKEIVIVTRTELIEEIRRLCVAYGYTKVVAVTEGGASRPESVMRGLDSLSKDVLIAAVHDGARPFVSQRIIDETVEKALDYHAAAPAVPVKDTIKVVENHIVKETPNRAKLYAVQTPQIFDFDLLRGALSKALQDGVSVTDDCSAVEAIGMSVYLCEGSDENIKITTPTDLILANAIWEGRL